MSALELSAVLFDMDGTLFDTERLSLETWLAVGQEHGWTQVTERYPELIGQNRESIRAKMRSWLGPDFPVEEFLQTCSSRTNARIEREGVPLKKGAGEVLALLAQCGVPMALATSTGRERTLRRMELSGLGKYFSVITAEGSKNVLIDEFIAPDVALLDSICIQHVPPAVIADTGMDVLVHALEAYVSTDATDFTDALAEKAAELIFAHLKELYDDPANGDARDRVQNASCIAGIAFTNSNLGITHSLAHALGAQFHLPHGRANALMMEAVIAYNADLAGKANNDAAWKYQKMARELNLPARTPREGVVSLLRAIASLKRELGIPHSIQATKKVDVRAFEDAVENMAEEAMHDRCTPTNPVKPTKEDLIALYRKSFD